MAAAFTGHGDVDALVFAHGPQESQCLGCRMSGPEDAVDLKVGVLVTTIVYSRRELLLEYEEVKELT
eukprot:1541264-Prymnesium_polylepis.1